MEQLEEKWPIGVFVSIDEGLGVPPEVASELGLNTIHLHAPTRDARNEKSVQQILSRLQKLNLEISVVFAGFSGESYADIPTVKKTIGLVPETTRSARMTELKSIIDFTHALGVDATGLHLGFVPHDFGSQDSIDILEATQEICEYARSKDVNIHLETGQEPADVLLEFLQRVDRPNIYVNFDPANMILYGCGAPLPALEKIGHYVRSVHLKDAKWSEHPGITWGEEVPLGEGDVDIPRYLDALRSIGYSGPLVIEREIPQEPTRQKLEISQAASLIQEHLEERLLQTITNKGQA